MSVLYSYQKEIINNNSRLFILRKSRQIGGSFALAFKAVHKALKQDRNQLIVSNSQRQSKIVMSHIEKFIEAFKEIEEFKSLKLEVNQTAEKKFPVPFGGASIFSLPPNPETIRGFAGDVTLDEFALYKNDKKIYEAVLPVITRSYDLSISSTCFGMQNMFHEIFTNDSRYKDYTRQTLTIYDCIEQGLDVDVELIKNNFDEDSFRQEFLCEFIDESTSYFPYVLLRELIDDYEEVNVKGKCYIGIDVGRSHDRTAILVIREIQGVFYLTRKEVLNKMPFDEQIKIIGQVFYEENPERVLVDKGGIGMQLAETLKRNYLFVSGVSFNNNFISQIVTNAKKLFEQKKFKMNEDKELISQIHSINKKVTESNLVSFVSKRDEKGHSDSAWALLLALFSQQREVVVKQW